MANSIFDWNEFKLAISYLKKGIDELYFRDVIRAATDKSVLKFDNETINILIEINDYLAKNLERLSDKIEGEYNGRINELGNYIEAIVKTEINRLPNITCATPTLKNGTAQSTGYPDYIIQSNDNTIYADVKIYQEKTLNSTLRSFYYQPTNKVKILSDAPHCLIGFEIKSLGGNNNKPFKIIGYRIVDLYDLKMNFKAEFNADNIEVYSQKTLFASK